MSMKKNYKFFKFLMCFLLGALSIFSIAFLQKDKTYASDQISVTFDVDMSRLSKYMPSECLNGVGNQTVYVDAGDSVSFPQFPSAINTYYTYTWQLDGVAIPENDFTPITNCVIKIKWEPIPFTIHYNYLYNEDSQITNIRYTDTYSIEKPVVYYLPRRPHYAFVDWYSSPNFSETAEVYADKYARGDKYIYAKWRAIEYKINYNTDASNIDNPNYYTYETPTFYLSEPKKEGHIFEGWYLDEDFTTSITTINNGTSGNLNLYPKWQLEKEKVTYILPDGESESVMVDYGTNAPKPSVQTNMFTILAYDKSTKNITEDTTIVVRKINIWYVYVLVLAVIIAIVIACILIKKKNSQKMHKLRLVYQSNLSKNKRKIR